MTPLDRYRSILAGLTSWDYVEQCDRYCLRDGSAQRDAAADRVLAASLSLAENSLQQATMGSRLKEAIQDYRKAHGTIS